jgi:hypothetical protein
VTITDSPTPLTTRQLCNLAGITYRQADYWTRQGYLRTCGPAEPGSGHHRRHRAGELRVALGLAQLLAAGCSQAAEVAEALRDLPDTWASPVLLDARGRWTHDLAEARWVVQAEQLAAA